MQKLAERNTYTPTDTPLVCGNCDLSLNKEETLSVINLKTLANNPEVDKPKHEEQNLRVSVYVLNMRGKPLMPTTPKKARNLLKEDKAKVVKRIPFTIQLKYATGENKQPIKLGIDAGYSKIGFSAVSDKKELVSGEVSLRTDIPKRLITRKMYRRGRRNRLRYRQSRFLNRKKKDLSPSMQHKLDSHVRIINKIKEILPITNTIMEVASFDTQKMINPEISGIEYQQGELEGYEVREYLLEKFKRTCVYCGKTKIPLQIEHLIPLSRGGTNKISNLAIACEKCNQDKGNMTAEEYGFPELQKQVNQSLKSVPFMNVVKKRISSLIDCDTTYGFITKHNRIKLGLSKSHVNDAFVIAGGINQSRNISFIVKQNKRNNRKLQVNRKGFKPSIRRVRYKYQLNDLVVYNNKDYYTNGMRDYGKKLVLVDITKNIFDVNPKCVKLITYGKGTQFIQNEGITHKGV